MNYDRSLGLSTSLKMRIFDISFTEIHVDLPVGILLHVPYM